jgi:tetratricopeptide (TPR) repeat protein
MAILKTVLGGGRVRACRASLAFFGKHPAFADFMPRIGAESEVLVHTKQALLQGLEEQKSQWEELRERELHAEKLIEGFDHWFLWLRPGRVLFGLLWSSRDAISREDAAGLCVDAEGVSPRFVLAFLRPVLEGLSLALRATKDPAQVEALCEQGREQLTRLVMTAADDTPGSEAELRRAFLERPEMGPDRQGWRRVLHALQPVLADGGRPDSVGQVRVPMGAASRGESLRLWSEFLAGCVRSGTPVLAICREGAAWVDLVAGEPLPRAFRCLQASTGLVPLTTATPYDVDREVEKQWPVIERRWLSGNGPARSSNPWLWIGLAGSSVLILLLLLFASGGSRKGIPGETSKTLPAPAAPAKAPPPPAPAPAPVAPAPEKQATAPAEQNSELARLMAAARAAESAGNFTNALELYWAAKKLSPDESGLLDKIKELTPKGQEQNRLAGEQARQAQLAESEFRRTTEAAAALAAKGDLTNALRTYQAALKMKDDPQVRAAMAALNQKIQEAAARALKEAQDAKQFEEKVALGRKAEEEQNYSAALASYQAALALRKGDPVVTERIRVVGAAIEAQKKAEATRLEAARRDAERFESLTAAATRAEQAGSFTNALASLREAQALRPTDEGLAARIKDLAPRAEQQARESGQSTRGTQIASLDAELEVLLVSFGLLKPEQAKTENARKVQPISGLLGMEDLNAYLGGVNRLETDFRSGGWLDPVRADKIKKLKAAILSRN